MFLIFLLLVLAGFLMMSGSNIAKLTLRSPTCKAPQSVFHQQFRENRGLKWKRVLTESQCSLLEPRREKTQLMNTLRAEYDRRGRPVETGRLSKEQVWAGVQNSLEKRQQLALATYPEDPPAPTARPAELLPPTAPQAALPPPTTPQAALAPPTAPQPAALPAAAVAAPVSQGPAPPSDLPSDAWTEIYCSPPRLLRVQILPAVWTCSRLCQLKVVLVVNLSATRLCEKPGNLLGSSTLLFLQVGAL